MVGVGVCTDTLASVCVGTSTQLMDPDLLTLAQYQDSPTSTFPVEYGSQVDFRAATVVYGPQPLPPNFQAAAVSSDETTSSTVSSVPVVEDSCYFMLERLVY